MMPKPDPHYRHRFPAEIISHAVWLYHVFSLSLCNVELILAERGVVVSYGTVRRWCKKFAATFADRLRRRRPRPGDSASRGRPVRWKPGTCSRKWSAALPGSDRSCRREPTPSYYCEARWLSGPV